jgi:hypothetical protein
MTAMAETRVTLRSFRLAFELERRIHRIDRFRIPVPYGLPLAGLGYGTAVALIVLFASHLPALGAVLALLPWPVRLLLLPGVVAHLLCRPAGDGRPVHEALVARATRAVQPRALVGLRAVPRARPHELGTLTIVADERAPWYRRGHVTGPAVVMLRQPARLVVGSRTAVVRQLTDRPMMEPREVVLHAGERLRVR